jgi:hypothetical protein
MLPALLRPAAALGGAGADNIALPRRRDRPALWRVDLEHENKLLNTPIRILN